MRRIEMNGFSPHGSIVVHICSPEAIHNPVNWPGVISADPQSNFWIKDGELFDPEIDGLPAWELEAMSYDIDPDTDRCPVCNEPSDGGRCRDCR